MAKNNNGFQKKKRTKRQNSGLILSFVLHLIQLFFDFLQKKDLK